MAIITDQYSVIRALKAKSDCGNIVGETQPTYMRAELRAVLSIL